ncbi:methylenesterol C-methyltransferase 2 [Seminavis robusta]|uniref:Methyltransferase n=1 Tax=Seminavis robusta TaxID=568900 RepID=A0A9N8HZJ2_9STRA|nr:methylenesterol C-methyltransferase 2 [Seminavis robusta]|eukprot:Sro3670_g350130.1 methylenesterol C-methyltransferase 2 (415) ;mRNA; f:3396-4640
MVLSDKTEKMLNDISNAMMDKGAITSVGKACVAFVGANVVYRVSRNLKRDAHGGTFTDFFAGGFNILSNKESILSRDKVKDTVDSYESLFDGVHKETGKSNSDDSIKKREKEYKTMVDSYYNLVTDFYEMGWGQSFHFAPRVKGETLVESIKRCEYYLALRAGMGPKTKAIDVGCGVGGPMRNIQQFTGSDITGVTINEYQVKVGNEYCQQKGIDDKCRLVQGDFQKLNEIFEPDTYDVAFAIEATCHSPDRVQCFSGVNKALKKGGIFVGYEWIVLPEGGFDKNNKRHIKIKEGIEVGSGLPTLATSADIVKALEDSGFEVLEHFDANKGVHRPNQIPWYDTLNGTYTIKGFRSTRLGRLCTHIMVSTLEFLWIAPKGTTQVSTLLSANALDLVEGGKDEIFTPSYFFMARKK